MAIYATGGRILASAVLLGACLLPGSFAQAQAPASASVCETCHGPGGDSRFGAIPRLNGQPKGYILERLKEFLDPTHETPHASQVMGPNAARLSDADAAQLADYLSNQAPTRANGFGAEAELGKKIFLEGAEPAIPACSTCHGKEGDGLGTVPRLRGQHYDYLMEQLNNFATDARSAAPMNRHVWDMTLRQMRALAFYRSKD